MKFFDVFLVLLLCQNTFNQEKIVKVAILGTNDIHGVAFPTPLYRTDTNQSYSYGGLEYMASMIETIRNQFQGNFLYLDAGDQFQGGIESSPSVSSGEIINDFMSEANMVGSAIGNHQFDFGQIFLLTYLSNRSPNSYNLAANLVSETAEQQFLPKHKNIFLYQLPSGIKIGVIGLSTIETPYTTIAFKSGSFQKYKFKDYLQIVKQGSKKLRSQGADAVILLSHVGNKCNASNEYGIWLENMQQSSSCLQSDQISKLILDLPQNTLDGIVQGHRHTFSHHFIKGIPAMGNINGGAYFNVLHLHFQNKKIVNKFIQGPVPVCQKVFQNTRTCNYLTKQQLKNAGRLINWKFHNIQVVKHEQVSKLFQNKWKPLMDMYFQPLAFNEILLQRSYSQQNPLGNLITDLISSACPGHDFVLINGGSFRTTWYPGIIEYQHFYNMLPFPNVLISFQMTGYELFKTLHIIQNGKKSFYPSKNLRQKVKIYKNGTKQLQNVAFMDGRSFYLNKVYRGVSTDFVLSGGDDFKEVIGQIYTLRKQIVLGDLKSLLKAELIKLKTITQSKILDPSKPRIIIDSE